MKTIFFENDGLIDMRAVTVFGASSKETENPIGYFGTGLKYAIAVVLRLGCAISIFRGGHEYEFFVRSTRIRVDDFDLVCMRHPDGTIQELSFTTELGKNWEAWQAFRELWCNALDEGGSVEMSANAPQGTNRTVVYVRGEAMAECYNIRGTIMLMGAPKWLENGVEIHYKPSAMCYYRNVRIGELKRPSVLTYNVVGHGLTLTEDRTLKYAWDFDGKVAYALVKSADEGLLKELVHAEEGSYEAALDFSDYEPSTPLMNLLEETDFRNITNKSLINMYRKQKGETKRPKLVEVDLNEQHMLTKALNFLKLIGYTDIPLYKINISDDLGTNILGHAYDGEIWIARAAFLRGTKMVAGTIFEEWAHLHHGYVDETRDFQNFFLDSMMTVGEKLVGEPL